MTGLGLGLGLTRRPPPVSEGGGGGAPDLAFAGLRAGDYEIDGDAVTLADIFVEDAGWVGFDPSDIVADVGFVDGGSGTGPVFTIGLTTQFIASGVRLVADWVAEAAEGSHNEFQIALFNTALSQIFNCKMADTSSESALSANSATALNIIVNDSEDASENVHIWNGPHRVAFEFAANGDLAVSIDGRDAQSLENTEGDESLLEKIGLYLERGTLRTVRALPLSATPLEELSEPPTGAPANIVRPVVSGTAQVGEMLSCTQGTWSGDPTITYSYQWVAWVNDLIEGATSNTFLVTENEVDTPVSCRVTASNSIWETTTVSADTDVVVPA